MDEWSMIVTEPTVIESVGFRLRDKRGGPRAHVKMPPVGTTRPRTSNSSLRGGVKAPPAASTLSAAFTS
jgi:hypothetical protein